MDTIGHMGPDIHREVSIPYSGAIIVAAGSGARLGADVPKALVEAAGRSLVSWCLAAFDASPRVASIVIVAPSGHLPAFRALAAAAATPVAVVPGGATRADSVACGLEALAPALHHVLVHDAARPLVTPAMVAAVLDGIGDAAGAILAAPLADTLKRVAPGGLIADSPSREGLWGAQTPQAFVADALRDAVATARAHGRLGAATDCSSLMEAVGRTVRVVDPGAPNLKVTTTTDLALVEALLSVRGRGPVG